MVSKEQFLEDFKRSLNIKTDITLDTDLLDIDEWSSFSMVLFISMVEEKYGIKAEPFCVAEAVFLEDLYHIVEG
ncbi:MAG: hypothetical protein K6G81_08595 [Lachnospiraceae bacterium]|nr:hypothetical protein [Lachnospiraceae bacterium]